MTDVGVFRDIPRNVDEPSSSSSNVEPTKQEKKRPMSEAKRTAWEKCLLAKAKKKEEKERFLKDQTDMLEQKTHEIRESLKKEILGSMHGTSASSSRKESKKVKSKKRKHKKDKKSKRSRREEEESEESEESGSESEKQDESEEEQEEEKQDSDSSDPPSSSSDSEEEEKASRRKKGKKSKRPARKKGRTSSSSEVYIHPPRIVSAPRKPYFEFV